MTAADSPEPKFRRRAGERPDELLDAAKALFTEKGYANTSVAQIARRAGVSKGALYLYFPSKQAVLEGLVRRAVEQVGLRALATASAAPRDLRKGLRAVLRMLASTLGDPEVFAIPKIVIREAVVAPEIAEMYRRAVFDAVLPAATRLIEHGIATGQIRPVDPELTVRTVAGPIMMHILLAEIFGIVPEAGLTPQKLADNHFDILVNGLFTNQKGTSDA